VGCAPFQPGAAPGARGAGRTLPTTLHPSMRCRSPITASIPSERR
jgi:hypothetical protein